MKICLHFVKISCNMKLQTKMTGVKYRLKQEKLAAIRRAKNISQREIAELIGVATETYNNKELGKTQFKASEMFIIASFFGKKVDDIFLPPDFTKHEVEESEVI